jgi:hypothetical protein
MQQSAREGTRVAPDWRYVLFLIFGLMLGGGGLFNVALEAWWTLPSPPHLDSSSLLFPLVSLIEGITLFGLAWRFKVLNRRRQAAAGGDPSIPPAAEQPIPNEAALPLPFTITLVPRRAGAFAASSLIGVLFFLVTFWLLFTDGLAGPGTDPLFTIICLIALFSIAIGFAIFLSFVFIRYGYNEITATEAGLAIRERTATRYIPWHEARLFAIIPGIKRSGPPTFYELSSAATFAAMTRLRCNTLFPFNRKPALPFDEYDRQMEALLSLIAAKTGLPLYELR